MTYTYFISYNWAKSCEDSGSGFIEVTTDYPIKTFADIVKIKEGIMQITGYTQLVIINYKLLEG
jgi:hypothetical protein